MFNNDESMKRFVESVQQAKEISLKVFKNNKRWSRIHDNFILDNWALLSHCMYNNRSMGDTTKFLVDMLERMDEVVDRYIDIHKRKPLHWHSLAGSMYLQMHCKLYTHTDTPFDDNDIHFLIEHTAHTILEISAHVPKPTNLIKLKIDDLRLIKKIIQKWLKNTHNHKTQIEWGAKFETSSFGQAIGGFFS
jgi:hypothetical protein